MSLAENMDLWMVAERDEARQQGRLEGEQVGEQRGLEAGHREGEQLGLNRGRRDAVLLALELKFGNLGIQFWLDHFSRQMFGPWGDILAAIKKSRTLDDLHRYRPRP